MQKEIDELVLRLELQPHPEGGFYKETYRSEEIISAKALENAYVGDRHVCTGIYFLLTAGNFSAFHRIVQDEMWHFYEGDPLWVHSISPQGVYKRVTVGRNFEKGEVPQYVVPGGYWFASEVAEHGAYSLVGCTVAPGFDFADFELAERQRLTQFFPQHAQIINRLTRP